MANDLPGGYFEMIMSMSCYVMFFDNGMIFLYLIVMLTISVNMLC